MNPGAPPSSTSRALGGCGLLLALVLMGGCTTSGGIDAPAAEGEVARVSTIAFEPVTGVPDDRAATLAEELVSGAVARGLAIVPRHGSEVSYRIKGYVSASRAGNETAVIYVWDIFDAEGARVHRVMGRETIAAGLPDPWQAVTDDALRTIARRTVGELDAWLSRGSPTTSLANNAPPRT